jgi:hypothetical protein
MDNRPNLQTKFEEILGSHNVYFQPPPSVQLKYPAIVYSRKNIDKTFANNGGYMLAPCYEVILIDANPDSQFIEKILEIPFSSFDRHYEADRLNHDVFTIYNN